MRERAETLARAPASQAPKASTRGFARAWRTARRASGELPAIAASIR
jgi:hypothetical protein